MAGELKIEVNDVVHSVDASPDTPLLYVLRNELHRRAPRGHCRHREVCGIRGTREGVARYAERVSLIFSSTMVVSIASVGSVRSEACG